MHAHARRHLALTLLKLSDGLWLVLAYFAARWLSQHHHSVLAQPWPLASAEMLLVAATLAGWHQLLGLRGLHASRRLDQPARELWDLCLAVSLQACIVATGGLLLGVTEVATGMFAVSFWGILLTLTASARLTMRWLLRALRFRGRNLRFALIIGSGPRALQLASALQSHHDLGYRLIGCIDDAAPPAASGMQWMGPIAGLTRILSDNVVDEVFVALPVRSGYSSIESVVQRCEEQGVAVTMPADFIPVRFARMRVSLLEGRTMLRLSSVPEDSWQLSAKRALDLVGALTLTIVLAPVFVVIALAILADSRGPALFCQTRVGLNKRPFTLYKFRTMVQGAERAQDQLAALNEAGGPVFKMREDPRLTPLGQWLRRTSLDELPQLVNVITGHMSLVGPRPLPVRDVQGFSEDWQRRRFSVLPGITCLWQMSGRSNISFQRWMEMDLEYIDRWSLWLDLSILARTIPAVLKRQGAY